MAAAGSGDRSSSADVIVVDSESRHLPAHEARDIVACIVREAVGGLRIPRVFKKTDSGLRGNIGAELEGAIIGMYGSVPYGNLAFVPAFPAMGRTTEKGIQLVDGVPVAQSVFGRDPFSPVRHSRVVDIISEQTDLRAVDTTSDYYPDSRIVVFDSESDEDQRRIADSLFMTGSAQLVAGCAGFADAYVRALCVHLTGREPEGMEEAPERIASHGMLVICGSLNPVSLVQLDHAEAHGFVRMHLDGASLAEPGFWDSAEGACAFAELAARLSRGGNIIVDTLAGVDADAGASRGIGVGIARSLGELYGRILGSDALDPRMDTFIIGGDTLIACMERIGVDMIEPACELAPGVVLSHLGEGSAARTLITKSGGFGGPELLVELVDRA